MLHNMWGGCFRGLKIRTEKHFVFPSMVIYDKIQLRVELRRMIAEQLKSFLCLIASGHRFQHLLGSLRVSRAVRRVCMNTRWVDIIWTYLQIHCAVVAPFWLSLVTVTIVCNKRVPSGSLDHY